MMVTPAVILHVQSRLCDVDWYCIYPPQRIARVAGGKELVSRASRIFQVGLYFFQKSTAGLRDEEAISFV